MTVQHHCRHCGAPIIRADDGSRWYHVVGYRLIESCGFHAEPIPDEHAP